MTRAQTTAQTFRHDAVSLGQKTWGWGVGGLPKPHSRSRPSFHPTHNIKSYTYFNSVSVDIRRREPLDRIGAFASEFLFAKHPKSQVRSRWQRLAQPWLCVLARNVAIGWKRFRRDWKHEVQGHSYGVFRKLKMRLPSSSLSPTRNRYPWSLNSMGTYLNPKR